MHTIAQPPHETTLDRDPHALLRHVHEAVRHRCPVPFRDRSEDIAQSLVVRLLDRARAANDMTLTPAYVRVAASHAVADEIRTYLRRRSFWAAHTPAIRNGAQICADRPDASYQAIVDPVRQQLRDLGPEAARAVSLYLEGERISEIATEMGWNPKKANNTVFRSLARLRKRLAAEGITADALV